MKTNLLKFIKGLVLLVVMVFASYLAHLHKVVVNQFSQPLNENTSHLSLDEHPKALINMLLITEDQSFFNHHGVDFVEIGRVLRDHWLYDKPIRGASTLSQQMVKNALLTREKTFERKLKEALMALLLEASFDKKVILGRYMNSVYLGQSGSFEVRGFGRAAQFYFNKKLSVLSLEELATLVTLIKGPSYYHPTKYPNRLIKRRDLVLRMYHKYKKFIK